MLVVLKIPIIYLAIVVWWAVRAAPEAPRRWRRGRRAGAAHALRLERLAAASSAASGVAALVRPRGRVPRQGAGRVSAVELAPARSADRVAGFLCAFSFALSGIAIVRTPGLLATAAILVALVAVV